MAIETLARALAVADTARKKDGGEKPLKELMVYYTDNVYTLPLKAPQQIQLVNDLGFLLERCGYTDRAIAVLQRVLIAALKRLVAYKNLADAPLQKVVTKSSPSQRCWRDKFKVERISTSKKRRVSSMAAAR